MEKKVGVKNSNAFEPQYFLVPRRNIETDVGRSPGLSAFGGITVAGQLSL